MPAKQPAEFKLSQFLERFEDPLNPRFAGAKA